MEISVVIKIASVGILVAILNQILVKAGRDDYALITALAGIAVALMMLLPQFMELLETAQTVFNM